MSTALTAHATLLRFPSSNSLALNTPAVWGVLPPIGSLEAYISAVNRMPMLSLDDEQAYARKLKDTDQEKNQVEAAGRLIMSHLRLVVSVARQYLGYGLPHADLIQEGNVGLMKAVRRFDPDQGVRLVSYAMHWIKAEIHEYILRNWRMVKVATTKSQRKLFFNLRSLKASLKQQSDDLSIDGARDTLSPKQIDVVATRLNVDRSDVIEMETRLMGGDVALDPGPSDDGEESFGPITYLKDEHSEPTALIAAAQRDRLASDGISTALSALDERSRRIVEQRWLAVNDDGSGGMTLHELANEYGVSAERIRQIEVAAMKKMKATLAQYA